MLARVLLLLEIAECLAAWRLAVAWRAAGLPWAIAIAAVLGIALGWRALLVLATYVLAGLGWPTLRVWWAETLAFSRAYLAMTFEPLLRVLDRLRARRAVAAQGDAAAGARAAAHGAAGAPRLVLIHGWCCNGAVWRPLLRAWLGAGGARPTVVNLAPVLGDIDRMALRLDAQIGVSRGNGSPLYLVAHSMGGLVARRWLQQRGATPAVAGLFTIGSPHAGTAMARWGPGRAAAQLRRGSDWLRRLEVAEPPTSTACAWSPCDGFIVPAWSAVRPGARAIEFAGAGHFAMLRDPRLLRALREFVREQSPPRGAAAVPVT